MDINNHCGRTGCRCTHTEGCERGYVWTRYKDIRVVKENGKSKTVETWFEGVLFCKVCDPDRAYIQETSKSSQELHERLRQRSNFKQAENYEKQEASKTRTL